MFNVLNVWRPLYATLANTAEPDRRSHNSESNQGLGCLLTNILLKFE